MLIWSPVVDWEQVPIGSCISVSNNGKRGPSKFWFEPSVIKCVFTGTRSEDDLDNDDDDLLIIEYDYIFRNDLPSHETYELDLQHPREFFYGVDMPDYDPDQEPEDDCL